METTEFDNLFKLDFDTKKELTVKELADFVYNKLTMAQQGQRTIFKKLAQNYFLTFTNKDDKPLLEIDTAGNYAYLEAGFVDTLAQTKQRIQNIQAALQLNINCMMDAIKHINEKALAAKAEGTLQKLAPELQQELLEKQNTFAEKMNMLASTYSWPFKELIRDIDKELRKAQED